MVKHDVKESNLRSCANKAVTLAQKRVFKNLHFEDHFTKSQFRCLHKNTHVNVVIFPLAYVISYLGHIVIHLDKELCIVTKKFYTIPLPSETLASCSGTICWNLKPTTVNSLWRFVCVCVILLKTNMQRSKRHFSVSRSGLTGCPLEAYLHLQCY